MIHKILNITSPHLRACNIIYLPPWATSQEEAATRSPATPCTYMSPTLICVARRGCDNCHTMYVSHPGPRRKKRLRHLQHHVYVPKPDLCRKKRLWQLPHYVCLPPWATSQGEIATVATIFMFPLSAPCRNRRQWQLRQDVYLELSL